MGLSVRCPPVGRQGRGTVRRANVAIFRETARGVRLFFAARGDGGMVFCQILPVTGRDFV